MIKEDLLELTLVYLEALEYLNKYLEYKIPESHPLSYEEQHLDISSEALSTFSDRRFSFYLTGIDNYLQEEFVATRLNKPILLESSEQVYRKLCEISKSLMKMSRRLKGQTLLVKESDKTFRLIMKIDHKLALIGKQDNDFYKNMETFVSLFSPLLKDLEMYPIKKTPQSHFGNAKGIVWSADFDEPLDDFSEYM